MDYVKEIKVFDCHEHLNYPLDRFEKKSGLLDMVHYIESDLRVSGLVGELTVEKIAKFYKNIFNTGYGKMLSIFAKDLYGIELFDVDSFYLLDQKIKSKSETLESTENWYNEILGKNNIEYVLTVENGRYHKHKVLHSIMYLDFLMQADIIKAETLDEHICYIDSFFEKCKNEKMFVGKFGIPYWHSLDMCECSIDEARNDFLVNKSSEKVIGYIFHYILAYFEKNNMAVQFHTGHIEPSAADLNKYQLDWSNPKPFNKYAMKYPELKFVLLHTSFPYQNEMLTLAKNYKNIYIDFSWIYIISPTKAKDIMKVALEMVPNNKIIAFGGDCEHIECVYAHIVIAKRIVNEVLNELVNSTWISSESASVIAEKIFFENPKSIYGINEL